MKSTIFRILFLTLSLLLGITNFYAQQTYPIYVTPQLTPPYSLVLSDYAQFGSQRLVVTINVRDVTVTNLPVRLHIKMETMTGVTIETIPTAPVIPIFLGGGEMITLFGDDMKDYFNINNLQFKGYSKDEYRRTGQLPEGFWRFTVEVRHLTTGRLISNRGMATAWMALGKPPVLKMPDNNAELGQITGMPLTFSWIPQNVGIPGVTPQYTFEMWEMRVPGINPNVVAASMPVFYSTTQMNTNLVIHPATLMLEPGMNYAWRVTASDMMGQVPFAQGGRSEVRSFIYQCRCDSITDFKVEQKGEEMICRWQLAENHTSYNVEMDNPISGWTRNDKIVDTKYSFKPDPGVTYRIRIQSICKGNEQNPSDFTSWKSITKPIPKTPKEICPHCECGKVFPDRPLTNFTLRDDLQPGDTIENISGASRYIIETAFKQSDATYKGLFLFWWEYYGVKIRCEYWDLQVNTDNWILDMGFKSISNPLFLLEPDKLQTYIDSLTNAMATIVTPEKLPDDAVILDFIIPKNPEYYYDAENGTITIIDKNGNPQEIELPKDDNGKPLLPTTLEDKNGNTFEVNEKGEIKPTSIQQDIDEVIVQGLSDSYEVVINNEINKATTDKKLKLVPENQKLTMKLQKNNGDSIQVANIQWQITKNKKTEVKDSTLTNSVIVADKEVTVVIYEKTLDNKQKEKKAAIAKFAFVPKQSPYITLSTLSNYDGEFGFDDGEDFKENSVPKQKMQYDTIHVADAKNKTKTLYIPWLTLVQGQPAATLKVDISKEIEGDSIYVESISDKITVNYNRVSRQITVTNKSLNNNFTKPEYIYFYRDDKYGLQKKMLIGKLAVVGMARKPSIPVQVVYFAKDTTKLKNTLILNNLEKQLNNNSLNQAFLSFDVLSNKPILLKDELMSDVKKDKTKTYEAIQKECEQKKGITITSGKLPSTIYIVMTEIEFSDDNGCAGGAVQGNKNLAIMWHINPAKCAREDIYKMIAHEVGHTLALREAFEENQLQEKSGNSFKLPNQGFSRNNYMDYSTSSKTLIRKMFFRLQMERMSDLN